jgi:hypothetical protein
MMSDYMAQKADDQIQAGLCKREELLSELDKLTAALDELKAENERHKDDHVRLMRDMGLHVANIEKLTAALRDMVGALESYAGRHMESCTISEGQCICGLWHDADALLKKHADLIARLK